MGVITVKWGDKGASVCEQIASTIFAELLQQQRIPGKVQTASLKAACMWSALKDRC